MEPISRNFRMQGDSFGLGSLNARFGLESPVLGSLGLNSPAFGAEPGGLGLNSPAFGGLGRDSPAFGSFKLGLSGRGDGRLASPAFSWRNFHQEEISCPSIFRNYSTL